MAYYMSSGVKVSEGAAGLGRMPPQAAAGLSGELIGFRNGQPVVAAAGLGRYFGYDDPHAAANGMGYPLYVNGKRVRQPLTLRHGPAGVRGLGQDVHGGAYTGTAQTRFQCMMEFQETNDYQQYEAGTAAMGRRKHVMDEGSKRIPFGTALRPFREGVLGGRGLAPTSFGTREQPFLDGIFGGPLSGLGLLGLGEATIPNGNDGEPPLPNGAPPDDKILGMKPATLTAVSVGSVVLLVGYLVLRKKRRR